MGFAIRKILHCDMDAFFASVEQRDNPDLRGRAVAVGGGGIRGVVMAASYEARAFGVRSAMPGSAAARACPDLVFVAPRMEAYRQTGMAVRAIFSRYTELVEPLSLDEAYLDVTEHTATARTTATSVARAIKHAVVSELGLTVSAGVSSSKFVAKVASGWKKPDGLTVIPPDQILDFIALLPIERFHGVGPATAARLTDMGVHNGADLRDVPEALLVSRFGKFGHRLHELAHGIDGRPVEPHRERKSVGAERTFDHDLSDEADMVSALERILDSLCGRLRSVGDPPWCTLTLKIRTRDFRTMTRSRSFPPQRSHQGSMREAAVLLLSSPGRPSQPVRLLGLTVSNFAAETKTDLQLRLALAPGA